MHADNDRRATAALPHWASAPRRRRAGAVPGSPRGVGGRHGHVPAALILLVLNLDNSSETVRSLRAPLHAAGWNPAMHHSTRCPKHAGLSAAHCSTRHNYTGVVGQLIKARGAVGPVALAGGGELLALLVIHCGTSMGVDSITYSNLMSVIKVQRATMLMSPSYFMPGHDARPSRRTDNEQSTHNRALIQLFVSKA